MRRVWNLLPKGLRNFIYNKMQIAAHSAEGLDQERISKGDVQKSLLVIQKRFPGQTVYFISDWLDSLAGVAPIGSSFVDKGKGAIYLCALRAISRSEEVAREIIATGGYYFFPTRAHPTARYFEFDTNAEAVLREAASIKRSHFDALDFEYIMQAARTARDLPGKYVEIGTFEGRSAQVLLNYLRKADITKDCFFLDTFAGITFETAATSADAQWFGSHSDSSRNSLKSVSDFLSSFGSFRLIACDIIKDPLPPEIDRIAFCNIDVDIYEAYIHALRKVDERLVPGGVIICEDFGHAPYVLGAKLAIDDFMAGDARGKYNTFYVNSGQMLLIKR
jgi:predicted O-methyltransferase YrrM